MNWCQALAYCTWAGKRLCGRVGGGPIGYDGEDAPRDANVQEWFGACSNGGTTRFSYGDTFDAEAYRTDYDSTVHERHTVYVFGSLELRSALFGEGDYELSESTEVAYLDGRARVVNNAGGPRVFMNLGDHLGSNASANRGRARFQSRGHSGTILTTQ